ncbi:MAG: hypothetical protein A2178_03925 [Planctomycetes bacterium GWC2_49_10]|nr:MAG: hypothetical protein A2178_03925 [Planctomycetes bacterium GWC2_49_10]
MSLRGKERWRAGFGRFWGGIWDIKGLWLTAQKRENTGILSACPWHQGWFLALKRIGELFDLVSEGCARGRRGTFFVRRKAKWQFAQKDGTKYQRRKSPHVPDGYQCGKHFLNPN